VQGGVEGPFLNGEDVVGGRFDPAGDVVPVDGTPADGLEDQEVEGPAKDVEIGLCHGAPLVCL
jgi:hypothetical protein